MGRKRTIELFGVWSGQDDNLLVASVRNREDWAKAFAVSYYGMDWVNLEKEGFIVVPVTTSYILPESVFTPQPTQDV